MGGILRFGRRDSNFSARRGEVTPEDPNLS